MIATKMKHDIKQFRCHTTRPSVQPSSFFASAKTPHPKRLPNLLQFLDFEDPKIVGKSAQPHFEALCRVRLGTLQLLELAQELLLHMKMIKTILRDTVKGYQTHEVTFHPCGGWWTIQFFQRFQCIPGIIWSHSIFLLRSQEGSPGCQAISACTVHASRWHAS